MAARSNKQVQRFYRVAEKHLGDAELLYEHGSKTGGAIYLGGYVVECALKALLLARTPRRQQPETMELFRGTRAHEFEWLKVQLRSKGVKVSPEISEKLSSLRSWSVAMRYDPTEKSQRETREFLSAARAVLAWVKRNLS